MRRYFLISLLLFSGLVALGQETATVMCYNVLNYPTGNIVGREDTLRKLVNYVQPDLFLIQELKNDSGLQLILETSFADLPANYEASTFVPQQSNPSSNWKLQQAIIYNRDMFGLSEEGYLQTEVRDLNKFKMYYRDPDLSVGADTLFFYVFVVHLKSSQGSSNEQARLAMAQTLTFHQQYLPDNATMIVGGDFNVYTSLEPAYEELLDPTNTIVLKDPINSPGDWHSSSFPDREVLTQSTRFSSIFGDGAGGGVDDRFDFVLLSEDMFQPWNTVVYDEGSYHAMGNTGNCYNQSITACDDGVWPDSILNSLYYMSDHLPVILDLTFGVGSVGIDQPEQDKGFLWTDGKFIYGSGVPNGQFEITVSDMSGRICEEQIIELTTDFKLSISSLNIERGVYMLTTIKNNGQAYRQQFVKSD